MRNLKKLSPQESLDIISNAIQKTKENFKEQSFYYLLWGWLVSIAAIINFLILNFSNFKHDYLPWAVLMPIGIIITIVYSIKNNKQKGYETYLDVFLKYLWLVLGGSFFLIVFISVMLKINPVIFTLFLAGIGTLISGLSMKFKPLIIGGILFFVFSLVSVFIDDSLILLINSIAIILGYLIPAYILKKS